MCERGRGTSQLSGRSGLWSEKTWKSTTRHWPHQPPTGEPRGEHRGPRTAEDVLSLAEEADQGPVPTGDEFGELITMALGCLVGAGLTAPVGGEKSQQSPGSP